MKVQTATGLILAYLKFCGFRGWASFWNTIYVRPGWENTKWLIRHEMKHLEQIERLGRLRFSISYLWELARHGYWNNKFEIEARAAYWPKRLTDAQLQALTV